MSSDNFLGSTSRKEGGVTDQDEEGNQQKAEDHVEESGEANQQFNDFFPTIVCSANNESSLFWLLLWLILQVTEIDYVTTTALSVCLCMLTFKKTDDALNHLTIILSSLFWVSVYFDGRLDMMIRSEDQKVSSCRLKTFNSNFQKP
uniref:Pecanex-like protein n=1 Tax=Caenorhabditis tropicalis TaxID=1561998 RepID=A0A1I7UNE7_9PELO